MLHAATWQIILRHTHMHTHHQIFYYNYYIFCADDRNFDQFNQ